MNFLTLCVIASLLMCVVFTIAVLVLSCLGFTVPEILIQYFFMTFGLEMGASAAIKIASYVLKRTELGDKIKFAEKIGISPEKMDFFGLNKNPLSDFEENGEDNNYA